MYTYIRFCFVSNVNDGKNISIRFHVSRALSLKVCYQELNVAFSWIKISRLCKCA